MIKHTIFALGIGMSLIFLYLIQYTGAFKNVTIGTDTRGPFVLIYKNYTGPYHKILSTIEIAEKWAKDNSVDCKYTFGEYFDNPEIVEEGRLRARAGCLIEKLDQQKMAELKKITLPTDFIIEEYPSKKMVIALFTGSPGIGPYKVYPKAAEYIKLNKYTKIGSVIEKYEVLDQKAMNTTYMWPIE